MKALLRFTPENLTSLPPNHVFVFGSNLAGRHGAGAAKTAHECFGAIMGCGLGLQGQSYAIATKDADLKTLPLYYIEGQLALFWLTAAQRPFKTFWLTRIGCGLAGYKSATIGFAVWSALNHLRATEMLPDRVPFNVRLPADPDFKKPFDL